VSVVTAAVEMEALVQEQMEQQTQAAAVEALKEIAAQTQAETAVQV
jgi:hypothetical protein